MRIKTYDDLSQWSQMFADNKVDVMFLIGNPGVGKTFQLRKLTEDKCRWIAGTMSAYGLYIDLQLNIDAPYVLDDVDSLYADRAAIRTLKQLCSTEKRKTLSWVTGRTMKEDSAILPEFTTGSKVCIIANEWKSLNKNIGAVEDRGIVLNFDPSSEEVHQKAGTWFTDREIYNFIGGKLDLIKSPSFRHYVVAQQVKLAGLDWQTALMERWDLQPEELTYLTLAQQAFPLEHDRKMAWCKITGMSESSYANVKRRLTGGKRESNKHKNPRTNRGFGFFTETAYALVPVNTTMLLREVPSACS